MDVIINSVLRRESSKLVYYRIRLLLLTLILNKIKRGK